MKLGIPTLNRYDLLDRLLRSIATDSAELPTAICIVDNGGGYEAARAEHLFARLAHAPDIAVFKPGRNLGVAGAWNHILGWAGHLQMTVPPSARTSTWPSETAEPVIISNDDLVFQPNTFGVVAQHLRDGAPFVGAAGGWALFGQSPACTRAVGMYDERFYPAYYEDCDYLLRLERAGVPLLDAGWLVAEHEGEASTKAATPELARLISEGRTHGYAYFIAKWGADSPRWAGPKGAHHAVAFGGASVAPGATREDLAPMRWEVLNHIALRIKAERYLEIGVSDGNCLRRVHVAEKWGVDPGVNPEGVAAADFFFPGSADDFWKRAPAGLTFDLIFIDGDHRSGQVLADVAGAEARLAPGGVIVLHDCMPHTEAMQQVPLEEGWAWTGDVWKAVVALRRAGRPIRVVPSDFGIGVLLPYVGDGQSRSDRPAPESYAALREDPVEHLGLLPIGHWKEWLDSALAGRWVVRKIHGLP